MNTSNDSLGIFTTQSTRLFRADIEFTSKCNIRCTYCPVSTPGDVGVDLDASADESVLNELKRLGPKMVTLNGRGESTSLAGWTERLRPFAAAFHTHLISNFARPFSRIELEFLTEIGQKTVSIDSADHEIMRKIRRRTNLDTIVGNILGVRRAALRLGKPAPPISIGSGIYDQNVLGLPELARLAVTVGAAQVNFWNLVRQDDIPDAVNVRPLDDLPLEEQRAALAAIDQAVAILDDHKIPYTFAGNFVDIVRQSVAERLIAEARRALEPSPENVG